MLTVLKLQLIKEQKTQKKNNKLGHIIIILIVNNLWQVYLM